MASAIERTCNLSDAEWRAMSEAAAATAALYNWDHSARLFEAALLRAIERARLPQPQLIECAPR
jgi:hypothetical protein